MSVEISRNSGEFDPEKIEREAVNILARVNLKLDDLRKYKRVLDLGAGLCQVERAVRLEGGSNIYSAGLKFNRRELDGKDLHLVEMDLAKPMPEIGEKYDLIFSVKGPLYHSKTEKEGKLMFENTLEMLSKNGKLRVFPNRFGFIEEEMLKVDDRFASLKAKAPMRRTPADLFDLNEKYKLAQEKTMEVLSRWGYVTKQIGYESDLPYPQNQFLQYEK